MSAEQIAEEVTEAAPKLVEAASVASADGLYISKGVLVGVVIAVAGIGFAAYKFGEKRTTAKYEVILKEQVEEAKAFYKTVYKKEEFETPESAAETLLPKSEVVDAAEALLRYQGNTEEDEDDDEELGVEEVNVFLQNKVDDDFDPEQEDRDPELPYVISKDEFFQNEDGLEQSTLTYYMGDGTLADEKEQEVPVIETVVGVANLERFGQGSGDSRVVYIRNERMGMDFEVVRHDGKYAYEVLGFEHADNIPARRKSPRRIRGEDE